MDAYRVGEVALLEEARTLAAACGAPETEAVTENHLAVAAWRRADPDALQEHAAAALRLARRYHLGLLVPAALILQGCAHALRSEEAAMHAVLVEARPLVGAETTQLVALHGHALAMCALTRDDVTAAAAELATAGEIARARRMVTVPPMVGMDVLLRTVSGADPTPLAAELRERDYHVDPLLSALLLAAEAVRLGRCADGTGATAALNRSLDDVAHNPIVQALIARHVAPVAALDGWGEPARWLTAALATFESRGLPEPAEACRSALRPPRPGTRADDITAREREVLGLVAEGLPNRAIAARLFLSSRTVEKHVERLLAKTGSANRSQLATYALRQAPVTWPGT